MNTDLFAAQLSQVFAATSGTSIAPIWRRFVAYLADSILLGFIGAGIGKVLSEQLSHLGAWGVLVGFFVSSLYFASLDCSIGNGQTLGKRFLKVRLVGVNGKPVSFEKAFARYSVFAAPGIAYGLKLPETTTPWFVSALVFVVIYWIGGSTFYLVMLERINRQGLHDLAVGSYVVYADHEGPLERELVPPLHWVVLVSLLTTLTVSAAMFKDWSDSQPTALEFHRDTRLVESLEGVQRAHITDGLTHGPDGSVNKILYISVTRKTKPANEEAFTYDLTKTLLDADRNLLGYDLVYVRLFYGYDIGVARHWEHSEFGRSPSAWRAH